MGIGFDFGPPPSDGKVDDDWFGTRALTREQLAEIAREIDGSDGAVVDEQKEDWFTIEGDHEEFVVRLGGGWLNKPSLDDEDEYDRLTSLMMHVADRAGWIVVGDGLVHGGSLRCTACGEEGFPYECPRGCSRSSIRLVCTQTPVDTPAAPERSPLDDLRQASTEGELSRALASLDREPPLDDVDVVLALLLSEDHAPRALDAIESLGKEIFERRASVLDSRLRRLATLADDPSISERAARLRR